QEPTAGGVDLVGDTDPGIVGAEVDDGPVAINVEMLGTRQSRSARLGQVAAVGDLALHRAIGVENGPGPKTKQVGAAQRHVVAVGRSRGLVELDVAMAVAVAVGRSRSRPADRQNSD